MRLNDDKHKLGFGSLYKAHATAMARR